MTKRRSRWFPSEPKVWGKSGHLQMLHEDFDNRTVPHGDHPEPYTLSVVGIAPQTINESLSPNEYSSGLEGFIRNVASRLLLSHEVWLEVAYGDEAKGRSPFRVFDVHGVEQTSSGDLIQKWPRRYESPDWFEGEADSGEEIELDRDRMVHVGLPEKYPGPLLSQVVRDLSEIEPSVPPAWMMDKMTGQRQDTPPFDVKAFFRTERLRTIQAALPIGWTARESLGGQLREVNDYYHYWRELRFLHFCLSMRARAEDALRQVLKLAGETCGFVASVTANGLYTPSRVETLIREFERGELSLSAVSDITWEVGRGVHSEQRLVV